MMNSFGKHFRNGVLCLGLALIPGCGGPQLSPDGHGEGVLRIGKRTCKVELIGPDEKILSYRRWTPDFPTLYIFEIHQGFAVSSALAESHSLVIVETAAQELKVLVDQPIYESTARFEPALGDVFTNEFTIPYALERDADNRPVVVLRKSSPKRIVLNLKK